MFSEAKIKDIVLQAFPGAKVDVADMTGGGDHFQLTVVSDHFEGKKQVERHRLVYAALGSSVGAEIHALALKTLTPQEK